MIVLSFGWYSVQVLSSIRHQRSPSVAMSDENVMWKTINESGEREGEKNNNWNATSQSRLTNSTSGSHLCAHTHWINVNLAIVADRHHIASKEQQRTRQIKTSRDVWRAKRVRRTSGRYLRIPVNFEKNAVAHLVAFAGYKNNTVDIYVFLIYVMHLKTGATISSLITKDGIFNSYQVQIRFRFTGSTGWCLIAAKQPNPESSSTD